MPSDILYQNTEKTDRLQSELNMLSKVKPKVD